MDSAQFPTKLELETLMKEKKILGLSMAIIENSEIVLYL